MRKDGNVLVQMDGGIRLRRYNRKTKFVTSYKGQEVGESHNRPRLEVTRHMKKKVVRLSLKMTYPTVASLISGKQIGRNITDVMQAHISSGQNVNSVITNVFDNISLL